jgi:hypothetical protein
MKLLLVIALLIPTLARSQDTVYWRPSRPLTWADFQAPPVGSSPFASITTAGIGYNLSYTEKAFHVTVYCYFLKSRSWTKSTNRKSLLKHEQGHFDITELYARRLQKAFRVYRFHFDTVGEDLRGIFDRINKEKTATNARYDRETNFSINAPEQVRWSRKIRASLNTIT